MTDERDISEQEYSRRTALKVGGATVALGTGAATMSRNAAAGGRGRGRKATLYVRNTELQEGRIYCVLAANEEEGQVCSSGNPNQNSVNCFDAEVVFNPNGNGNTGATKTLCVTGNLPIGSYWKVTEENGFCDEEGGTGTRPVGEPGPGAVRIKQVQYSNS